MPRRKHFTSHVSDPVLRCANVNSNHNSQTSEGQIEVKASIHNIHSKNNISSLSHFHVSEHKRKSKVLCIICFMWVHKANVHKTRVFLMLEENILGPVVKEKTKSE